MDVASIQYPVKVLCSGEPLTATKSFGDGKTQHCMLYSGNEAIGLFLEGKPSLRDSFISIQSRESLIEYISNLRSQRFALVRWNHFNGAGLDEDLIPDLIDRLKLNSR